MTNVPFIVLMVAKRPSCSLPDSLVTGFNEGMQIVCHIVLRFGVYLFACKLDIFPLWNFLCQIYCL